LQGLVGDEFANKYESCFFFANVKPSQLKQLEFDHLNALGISVGDSLAYLQAVGCN